MKKRVSTRQLLAKKDAQNASQLIRNMFKMVETEAREQEIELDWSTMRFWVDPATTVGHLEFSLDLEGDTDDPEDAAPELVPDRHGA